MAKKTVSKRAVSKPVARPRVAKPVAFGDLKVGSRFQFTTQEAPGRPRVFTKIGDRQYQSRTAEKFSTRSMTRAVRSI